MRVYALHRNVAPPADVRGDGRLLTAYVTARDNARHPIQRAGATIQQQKTYTNRWNSAAGMYVLECDPEHDHIGLPIADQSQNDELSLRYTSAAAAGGVLEACQESLMPNGRVK
jgi:hypothetical protein